MKLQNGKKQKRLGVLCLREKEEQVQEREKESKELVSEKKEELVSEKKEEIETEK